MCYVPICLETAKITGFPFHFQFFLLCAAALENELEPHKIGRDVDEEYVVVNVYVVPRLLTFSFFN